MEALRVQGKKLGMSAAEISSCCEATSARTESSVNSLKMKFKSSTTAPPRKSFVFDERPVAGGVAASSSPMIKLITASGFLRFTSPGDRCEVDGTPGPCPPAHSPHNTRVRMLHAWPRSVKRRRLQHHGAVLQPKLVHTPASLLGHSQQKGARRRFLRTLSGDCSRWRPPEAISEWAARSPGSSSKRSRST